jgi:hypothetical protein
MRRVGVNLFRKTREGYLAARKVGIVILLHGVLDATVSHHDSLHVDMHAAYAGVCKPHSDEHILKRRQSLSARQDSSGQRHRTIANAHTKRNWEIGNESMLELDVAFEVSPLVAG